MLPKHIIFKDGKIYALKEDQGVKLERATNIVANAKDLTVAKSLIREQNCQMFEKGKESN